MHQGERQSLLSSHSKSGNSGSLSRSRYHCDFKWLLVVFIVTTLFVLAAIFHDQIGSFVGIAKNSSSSVDDWKRIEFIESKYLPKQWTWDAACDDAEMISFTFALKQTNIEMLESELLAVSTPGNDKYGKHWTYESIHELIKPKQESISLIKDWLANDWKVDVSNIHELTPNGDFIRVLIDAKTANAMLNTQFGRWTHESTGATHVRVKEDYYVPSIIADHLDFVSPTLRFPIESHTRTMEMVSIDSIKDDSSSYVTPSVLTSLYGITMQGGSSTANKQAIASFLTEWYSDDDLSQFWDFFSIPFTSVTREPSVQPEGYGSEAELDVQYITSTGQKVQTVVWDIEDDLYFISLLQQIADSSEPPSVVSMSYGGDEQSNGWGYCNRANNEFAKVGLLGVTFLASSGDDGAISSSTSDCTDSGEFTPSFPASSPYVTAVGGTTGGETTLSDDISTGEESWYYSGGGFSYFFDSKPFQTKAVNTYLNTVSKLPSSERFVSTGAAYPDLAAQSVAYVICYEGSYYAVSGTSCSSPSVAGMIAVMNDMRLANGKTRLGWLNPVLYGLYDEDQDYYFNDVTIGYNMGCDDDGIAFYANKGWDPVTGLGTIKFERLMEALYQVGTTTEDGDDQ